MRVAGLEPARQRHTPLKRACLPIPAHSHFLILFCSPEHFYIISQDSKIVKHFFEKISKNIEFYFLTL